MGDLALKQARVTDFWRRWLNQNGNTALDAITCEGIPILPNGSIALAGRVTALVGLNGVGKSTLLKLIHASLIRPCERLALSKGIQSEQITLHLDYQIKGAKTYSHVTFSPVERVAEPEATACGLVALDTAFEVPALVKLFEAEQNLQELLDQSASKEMDPESLKVVSSTVGRNYSRIKVFEIDDFAQREKCPYFQVELDGHTYGSESMGLGEAAIHHSMWTINQVENHGIILIEEPESYVSFRSQTGLMDYLAKICSERSAAAVITSHSPAVFDRIPVEQTIIVARHGGGVKIFRPKNAEARALALGIVSAPSVAKDGVFVVEDRMGRVFCSAWLSLVAPDLQKAFRIIDIPGGAGEVRDLVKKFPHLPGWFHAVGLLDGDERGKQEEDKNISFLPGPTAPEMLMIGEVRRDWKVLLKLAVDENQIVSVLSSIEAMDHHDWFLELQKRLRINFDNLVVSVVESWLSTADGKQSSDAALTELRALLNIEV